MEKLLLTVDEAADACGLGRTKIYELMRSGQIRSVTIGTARRIPREAVEVFVRSLHQHDH